MVRRAGVAFLILLAACGRLHFDASDDGRRSAGDACAHGPFGPVQPLTMENTVNNEFGTFISADLLELWFSSNGSSNYQVYRATRASPTDMFGAPVQQVFAGLIQVDDPFLSDDKLHLWVSGTASTDPDIYEASRTSTTQPFGTLVEDTVLSVQFQPDNGASVTSDQLTMVFDSRRSDAKGDLFISTRASVTDAWSQPQAIAELDDGAVETSPSISGDGQTLIYVSDQLSAGTTRIVESFRNANGTFQPPHVLDPGLTGATGQEVDPTLSRDGSTIVFASDRQGGVGGFDLYMATRSCQ